MKKNNFLTGNIICAIPQLKDIFFSRTIIYITHHNKNGAIGIVLNQKIMTVKSSDLIDKLHIKVKDPNYSFALHIGGPMNQENGFILHSKDYNSKDSVKVSKLINLSSSTKIFEDIANNKGPKKFFISLGYSGWGPGQLENEFINNSWIHLSEKLDLIFDTDVDERWKRAIDYSGIDFSKLSSFSGSA